MVQLCSARSGNNVLSQEKKKMLFIKSSLETEVIILDFNESTLISVQTAFFGNATKGGVGR